MAKNNFLLLSMNEDLTKQLAQTITNPTCKKILDHLADKEHATESAIAKELNLPISTVHYNLMQLTKAKMVSAEEYHYSEKGKEILHYKLANKYVIIAPKSTYGLKEKLKSILPVAGILAGVGLVMEYMGTFASKTASYTWQAAPRMMEQAVPVVTDTVAESIPSVTDAVAESAPMLTKSIGDAAPVAAEKIGESAVYAVNTAAETINAANHTINQTIVQPVIQVVQSNPALWFILGAVAALVLFLIVDYIRKRK